jgi:hypothetical protein
MYNVPVKNKITLLKRYKFFCAVGNICRPVSPVRRIAHAHVEIVTELWSVNLATGCSSLACSILVGADTVRWRCNVASHRQLSALQAACFRMISCPSDRPSEA